MAIPFLWELRKWTDRHHLESDDHLLYYQETYKSFSYEKSL